jgi:23S rRNA pseudouridine1911/1915/1917 synthase
MTSVILNFTASDLEKEERLDKFLITELKKTADYAWISRSKVQELINIGRVKNSKNDVTNDISKKVKNGESFIMEVDFHDPSKPELKAANDIKLNIVFEDEFLIVLNKQAGLTVHPGAGAFDDTLVNALVAHLGENFCKNPLDPFRPGLVHRLDRDTTGLMLIAKSEKARENLSAQIQSRAVTRLYHAFVWNKPDLAYGKIDANISRSSIDRRKMSIHGQHGKKAVTHYKLLEKFFGGVASLVECKLETGRTHQIRVHFEYKRMPLLGDQVYKGQENWKKTGSLDPEVLEFVKTFPRQALHSKYIKFTHPETQKEMEFEIDYPEDLKELKNKLSK